MMDKSRRMEIKSIGMRCSMMPQTGVSDERTWTMNSLGASIVIRSVDGSDHQAGILSATSFGYRLDTHLDDKSEWVLKVIENAMLNKISFPLHIISSVTVHEKYRGMGIGKAMMSLFLGLCPGTHALMAETEEKPWLSNFYESLGFDKIGMDGRNTIMIRDAVPPPAVTVVDGKINCA